MANLLVYGMLMVGLLSWGILRLMEVLGKRAYRSKRVPIHWYDPDAGSMTMKWEKRSGNELKNQDLPGGKGHVILSGKGRIAFGKFRTWIIHSRTGANLVGPTDERLAEIGEADPQVKELEVSNALSYWHAIANDEARSATEAGKEEEPAWVRMMPLMMIGIIVLVAMTGWVIYQMVKLLAAAGAANAGAHQTGQVATAHAMMLAPHALQLGARVCMGA